MTVQCTVSMVQMCTSPKRDDIRYLIILFFGSSFQSVGFVENGAIRPISDRPPPVGPLGLGLASGTWPSFRQAGGRVPFQWQNHQKRSSFDRFGVDQPLRRPSGLADLPFGDLGNCNRAEGENGKRMRGREGGGQGQEREGNTFSGRPKRPVWKVLERSRL